MPSNVLPLHLKQTFPSIIWIFTEGEGDEIKSRLSFKIFSALKDGNDNIKISEFFKKKTGPKSKKTTFSDEDSDWLKTAIWAYYYNNNILYGVKPLAFCQQLELITTTTLFCMM